MINLAVFSISLLENVRGKASFVIGKFHWINQWFVCVQELWMIIES